MTTTRHLPRSLRVALAAIVAALLVTGHSSVSAGMVGGRMAQMRRDGCCCIVLPVGGCCCEPAAPAGPGPSASPAGSMRVVRTIKPAADLVGPAGSCQCRARPDHAGPPVGTSRRRWPRRARSRHNLSRDDP